MQRFRISTLLLPFQLVFRVLVSVSGLAVLALFTWIVTFACYRVYEVLDRTVFSDPWFP